MCQGMKKDNVVLLLSIIFSIWDWLKGPCMFHLICSMYYKHDSEEFMGFVFRNVHFDVITQNELKLKCINTFVLTPCRVACDSGNTIVTVILECILCDWCALLLSSYGWLSLFFLTFSSSSSGPVVKVDTHTYPHSMGSVQHNAGITVKSRTVDFILDKHFWLEWLQLYVFACFDIILLNLKIFMRVCWYTRKTSLLSKKWYSLVNHWMVCTVQTLDNLHHLNLSHFRYAFFPLEITFLKMHVEFFLAGSDSTMRWKWWKNTTGQ
jgi:hypothetical protein